MSAIFNEQSLYPQNKVNSVDFTTDRLYEVPAELAYNPAKVALAIYDSIGAATELWLVNRIKNPFKELYPGRILRVPNAISMSKANSHANTAKPIKVKKAKINGQKITY